MDALDVALIKILVQVQQSGQPVSCIIRGSRVVVDIDGARREMTKEEALRYFEGLLSAPPVPEGCGRDPSSFLAHPSLSRMFERGERPEAEA